MSSVFTGKYFQSFPWNSKSICCGHDSFEIVMEETGGRQDPGKLAFCLDNPGQGGSLSGVCLCLASEMELQSHFSQDSFKDDPLGIKCFILFFFLSRSR